MSPFERMVQLHEREPEAQPFGDYVAWHLRHGFVFSTPEVFLMAVAVVKTELRNGRHPPQVALAKPDCWLVSSLAGDLAAAWALEPYPLPWFAFTRRRGRKTNLKFWPRNLIKRKTPSMPYTSVSF